MRCDEVRLSLGAYTLGALPAPEADAVRAHLDMCPDCTAELAELAGLPDMLAMVPGAEVGLGTRTGRHAATTPPSDTPRLEQLFERAAAERARGRNRSRIMAGLTAVAAAMVVLFGVAVVNSGDQAPGTGHVTPPPGTITLSAHEASGEWAQLKVTPKGWGTLVALSLGGVTPGKTCRLEAVGPDGSREIASTWQVPTEGYSATSGSLTIPGAVGMPMSSIDHYEVVTAAGDKLLTIRTT
jgi:Putative zinc-finger